LECLVFLGAGCPLTHVRQHAVHTLDS
jgi:hypothetical protein